jgi:hypothetical protein
MQPSVSKISNSEMNTKCKGAPENYKPTQNTTKPQTTTTNPKLLNIFAPNYVQTTSTPVILFSYRIGTSFLNEYDEAGL